MQYMQVQHWEINMKGRGGVERTFGHFSSWQFVPGIYGTGFGGINWNGKGQFYGTFQSPASGNKS